MLPTYSASSCISVFALRQAVEGDELSLETRRRVERILENVRGPADADAAAARRCGA